MDIHGVLWISIEHSGYPGNVPISTLSNVFVYTTKPNFKYTYIL